MSSNHSRGVTPHAPHKSNRVAVSPLVFGSIVALVVALLWRTLPSTRAFVVSVGMLAMAVFGFLASVVLFIHFYNGKTLRKAAKSSGHISDLVNDATKAPEGAMEDFDRMVNPEGLSNLWKSEIQDNEKTFRILLTGVTGYVGRAVLFQLLREIAKAEEEAAANNQKRLSHKVYVMTRGNTRKNLTATDRLTAIRDEPMFAAVKKQWDDVICTAESGDLKAPKCGMSDETVAMLGEAQLTHVVHCAADVNFNRPLPESSGINISPALQLQELAKQWTSCKRFVHCSTAFVNPGPGSDEHPMREALFPLGNYDPQDLYDSMRGDQTLALKCKKEMGFSNNYVLTKCVGEHLVTRHNDNTKIELRVVRPAVVGPSWLLPYQGWNGDKPSTISGVFLLWATRVIRCAPMINRPFPVVPVDVVAAGIIHAMIAPPAKKEADKFPLSYRNLIWSHKSPKPFANGVRIAKESIQAAMMLRHFSATEAAVSFFLLDIIDAVPALFGVVHQIFNLGPLYVLQFVCWAVKMTGVKTVLDQVPVVKLFRFSDMLTLYKPYMGQEFKFESSIDVPESFNCSRYSASLLKATQEFWTKMFPGTIQGLEYLDILPRGRLDLWWSLTQPCRNFKTRMVGYFACQILRSACTSMEVDLHTVDKLFHKMVELEETMKSQKHCVILAPAGTHRSVMDYILIKYITFTMVSTGIDVPLVLAKPEFDDDKCTEKLGERATKYDRHISLAAFLEDTPIVDGPIKKPSVDYLKKIVETDGDQDYTVIPMRMDYDSTNDSEILLQATKARSDLSLSGMCSLYWQICILQKVKPASLGDVRVSFGVPLSLEPDADLNTAATNLHSEFQRLASSSN